MDSPASLDFGGLLPRQCAVGCIRVSTTEQSRAYGPERQREEIEREAARNDLTVVHWIEESISGANHARATDNLYFPLARKHSALNFIFSHPNRVGRHIEVTVGIARQIQQLGGTVWIAGAGSLRDKRNWNYFLRDASSAEEDYGNIVDQLVRGKRSKATAGRWPHGAPPWGYLLARDSRGRSTVPEPVAALAPIIRRVADLGETMGETLTARAMAAEGHPTAGGGPWTTKIVANILRNERYTGRAVFQGIELQFEPIIPRDQWERIQQRRAVRTRESGPRDTSLLWAGHVRCAVCGSAVGRDAHKTRYAIYAYYRCWRARRAAATRQGHEPCTNTRNWPIQESDDRWWLALTDALTDPATLAEIVAPPPELPTSPPPVRMAELETAILRAWEPFAAGKVSHAVAERLAAPYTAELERLRLEYAPRLPAPGPDLEARARAFAGVLGAELSFEDRRELLDALDVRLYVGLSGVERISVDVH